MIATKLVAGNWQLVKNKDIPSQRDSLDCGVFMLMYALYITFEWPFDFSQVRALNLLQKLVDDSFSLPQFLMVYFVLLSLDRHALHSRVLAEPSIKVHEPQKGSLKPQGASSGLHVWLFQGPWDYCGIMSESLAIVQF
ncbi:uncharacterized protein LOC131529266 isoform X1 [Onychostoma macrolepis]|uniref:uncharacterized protein LOC131529266 isoform X1 n=1 Tax=Onychostoma macrolepis TaxID=369639 RepID=UPI00272B769F|nr:uncharacterized protein LOC131529266 isoform X1 [Onychostoma macrolepis]